MRPPLDRMGAHLPEPAERTGELQVAHRVRAAHRIEGRPEVVVLLFEPRRPGFLAREALGERTLREREELLEVRPARLRRLAGFIEALARVLAHRLEESVARLGAAVAVDQNEGLVDEAREPVHGLELVAPL